MRVKDFECRSFEQARALLKGKPERKVCNNTVLSYGGVCVDVLLHGYTIARLYATGSTLLFSRGWQTVTTKDRINRVLPRPWGLRQNGGEWELWNCSTREVVPFVEGIKVPR